jgi:hypothetical protein
VSQWGQIVVQQVRSVPDHSDWRYLGLPDNVEDDVRPTAYAAMVLSFLAEFDLPHEPLPASDCDQMRTEAVGLLRYLTASHVTGGGACVSGKPWGNQWQSALWARAVGMAAWQTWPNLGSELQEASCRLLAFEADRFISQPPKSSQANDTGAEENAWNAAVLSLACNMLPDHPHADSWQQAAKLYMYNSFSVANDANALTPGDDGVLVRDWVTTVNAHNDFTIENHRLVHVAYLTLTAAQLQENAIHWLLVNREAPKACQHHVPDAFDVLLTCMDWAGSSICFSGNDWKTYESQCCDVLLYCGLNLLMRDSRAAYLEEIALEQLRKQQQVEGGYYNLRRDLEYGGLCATRMIACCLSHSVTDSTMMPMDPEQFNQVISRVRLLPAAKTVVHRTPNKFASFTWSQKRMALTLSRDGCAVVWPHFSSYLGLINGEDSSLGAFKTDAPRIESSANSFQVSGSLSRCNGRLDQDFFFASPPGDYTVYIERLRFHSGFEWEGRETGVIGLEYPLGENTRRLYGDFGSFSAKGRGGRDAVVTRQSRWLNIDDRIGYVICREPPVANTIRFHDRAAGEGRVPHLQEWISLIGEETPIANANQWACIVTFPNQNAQQTKARAREVRFSVDGNLGICQIGSDPITADFNAASSRHSRSER